LWRPAPLPPPVWLGGGEGIPVHVDLPADAAVVSAAVGDAAEERVIIRISVLHGGVLP